MFVKENPDRKKKKKKKVFYLKLVPFKLENYREYSKYFLCGQPHWLGDTNLGHRFDLTDFQIQSSPQKVFRKNLIYLF